MYIRQYIFGAKSYVVMLTATLLVSVGFGVLLSSQAAANTTLSDACGAGGVSSSAICQSRSENIGGSFGANIVNTMLFVLGIIAVIMIIFGGFKYMTANGDSSKISSAKNTILYSVVGLVVAIMAWGIVAFVINQLNK